MKALVTGAAGFVGTHLCRYLLTEGAEVVAIDFEDCDITDTPRLRSIVADAAPDVVYHLAAVASVAESWERPRHAWRTNVAGTVSVLEAVRSAAPRARVLITSSASVHEGHLFHGRIAEDGPVSPVSPYGISKAVAEIIAWRYVESFGTSVIVARPTNLIGPGQSSRFLVPALCQRIREARRDGMPYVAIGRTDVERDFVDVREAVAALTAIAERGTPGRPYNVCSGRSTTIGALVRGLARLAGTAIEPLADFTLVRPADPQRIIGDPTRTLEEIGWRAQTPLHDSLDVIWAAMAGDPATSVPRDLLSQTEKR